MTDQTPILQLRNVAKSYGTGSGVTHVLAGIDLDIREGEFVAILGFSGSGKTTLVSTIAGLVRPDVGSVLMRGEPVTEPGPERGLVFQSYSLMPWLTVHGNIELAVAQVFPEDTAAEREARIAAQQAAPQPAAEVVETPEATPVEETVAEAPVEAPAATESADPVEETTTDA